ncbi:hypothetical protein NCG89_16450 [Spongiibacter taiwanensis]|uniref:hypothetical protein n=1 Tax=Spongiibacter taiwanensis TaxID=1748242 RepID=UPI002034C14E|nr:hypothetical protein [Spongiibacter taiwanensis]USA43117.1 hypothetical protein NCG89_16450 [Spongiibacter taiwanensis]
MKNIATTALTLLLLADATIAQTPDFSTAHQKVAKYFLGLTGQPITHAFWLRHDALVLGVKKEVVSAKTTAKMACEKLNHFGFASQAVTVYVSDAKDLATNQIGKTLAKRNCQG